MTAKELESIIDHTWCGECEHSSCGGRCRQCIREIVAKVRAAEKERQT